MYEEQSLSQLPHPSLHCECESSSCGFELAGLESCSGPSEPHNSLTQPSTRSLLRDLLLEAPKDVLLLLLGECLSLPEIAALDCALCEKSLRAAFTALLSSAQLVVRMPVRERLSHSALLWLTSRRLAIDSLSPRNRLSLHSLASPSPSVSPSPALSPAPSPLPRDRKTPALRSSPLLSDAPLSPPLSPPSRMHPNALMFFSSSSSSKKSACPRAMSHSLPCDTAAALIASIASPPVTYAAINAVNTTASAASPSPTALTRSRSLSLSFSHRDATLSLPQRDVCASVKPQSSAVASPSAQWDELLSPTRAPSLKKVLSRLHTLYLDSAAHCLSDAQVSRLLSLLCAHDTASLSESLVQTQTKHNLADLSLRGFKKTESRVVLTFLQSYCGCNAENSNAEIPERVSLRRVDLSGCWRVSDDVLHALSTNKCSVEVLDVSACFAISPQALLDCIPRLSSLREFHGDYSTSLNDAVWAVLWRYCERLESVSCVGCVGLTDACAKSLVLYGRAVRALDLCGVTTLSDEFLHTLNRYTGTRSLPQSHLQLKSLTLGGCSGITTEGVQQLALKCATLQKLSLRGCINVKGEEVQRAAPHLELTISV